MGMKNWKTPKWKDILKACLMESVFDRNPAAAATEKASIANPISISIMDGASELFTSINS
jgi:hypothetical protein